MPGYLRKGITTVRVGTVRTDPIGRTPCDTYIVFL